MPYRMLTLKQALLTSFLSVLTYPLLRTSTHLSLQNCTPYPRIYFFLDGQTTTAIFGLTQITRRGEQLRLVGLIAASESTTGND